ncbi:MAG: hypothetical protein SGPRY_005883, partial [Prymnesium sp.]
SEEALSADAIRSLSFDCAPSSPRKSKYASPTVRLDGPVVSPRHRKLRPLDPLYIDPEDPSSKGFKSARSLSHHTASGVHASNTDSPRSAR